MKRLVLSLPLLLACIPDEAPAPAAAPLAPPAVPAAVPPVDARDPKGLLKTVDALKDQLQGRPRDFGIDLALGNLYFDNGRYREALGYYADAAAIVARAESLLVAAKRRPSPSSDCRPAQAAAGRQGLSVEQVLLTAADRTGVGELACLAGLVPALANLRARQGDAWYLVGDAAKAREHNERALQLDPDQPEALFFRGASLLEAAHGEEAKLSEGRAVWERLLKVAPEHPRAAIVRETLPRVGELFGKKAAAMDGPGPLPAGVVEAASTVQLTPELAKQLDEKLAAGEQLLAAARWQEALDVFKGVMPLRPDGRVALGLGIALRELGKPTAERVLTQATRMPGGDGPRATYELGVFYERSDATRARKLFESLTSDATWGARAKGRLAGLR